MCGLSVLLLFCLASFSNALPAAESGDQVVVVYNSRMPESKSVAEHYAAARNVPATHVLGLALSTSEAISRKEFRGELEQPLLDAFTDHKWFQFGTWSGRAHLKAASVRYLVLCYGVPVKISRDESLKEAEAEKLPLDVRRNEAAVDNELAMLPVVREKYLLAGPKANPVYGTTNRALIDPTNSVLMVARLDGPSADIARHLVDKALLAESNGFWGRAYFDARGITNAGYKMGDEWIKAAATVARRLGFETVLDEEPATFPASFPMSQIALYAGWYDGEVSGPFTLPSVEFMPGAFAYHLHSFNAASIRTASSHWVGPLLAKGATITFGSVDEPFLAGTPHVGVFVERLIWNRFTFGEAAYAAQPALSWQTTVVGDPLFCPFAEPPDVLHYRLDGSKNPNVVWSHLRVVSLNQANGQGTPDEMIHYLMQVPQTTNSAVLQEKLGDLFKQTKRLSTAADAYAFAARLDPSPMQRIRLLLEAGEIYTLLSDSQQAYATYTQLLNVAPGYAGAAAIYTKLVPLARTLGKTNEAIYFETRAKK